MKNLFLTLLLVLFFSSFSFSQKSDAPTKNSWEFGADLNMYFYPGDFFVLPVFRADKDKLHLEARYNYEDMETFSGWIGYNFKGGKELEYLITPMIGAVAGRTSGFAPGMEFTFGYKGFELYNESELMFDVNSKQNNFSYSWTDLSYSPTDWLWFGASAQTTRMYHDVLEMEGGILLGGGYKNFELTGYLYNPGSANRFALLTLSASF